VTTATLLLLFMALAAGLLALAALWIYRTNLAVQPGRRPLQLRPAPVGCGPCMRAAPQGSGSGPRSGTALLAARAGQAESTTAGAATQGPGERPPPAAGPAEAPPAPAKAPKRKKVSGPSRRAFLRNSWIVAWLGVFSGFGAASIMYLWPNLRGGFGATIEIDTEAAILEYIRANREPFPYPAGRMYLVEYSPELDPGGQYAEITNGASVMALYQKCVHLGCKVPWCLSSQWFECPCHGSRYNRWGEWQGGPAPRGLDRFALAVAGGVVAVDTSTVVTGPSRLTRVLEQPAEGPSCL